MARKKDKNKQITTGGAAYTGTFQPDIILQMPQLFFFDIKSYINSLNAAKAIDSYTRCRLYDMYEAALLDPHLAGVIDKRLIGVSRIPIEFRRNGKPDESVNAQIRSPWFRRFVKDVMWAKFWGFSLFQFFREGEWIDYELIPRKHYDPVKRQLLRYQTDNSGIPIEEFPNMLFIGEDPRGLGILAELLPMTLYKRGNLGDWAQFCQIFGMPIREYTYNAGDEETRKRLLDDARNQGANAVYIHPKESALNLIESAQKSGTVDLYERFYAMCNTEISVRVLGNTLTTDSKANGTQALGKVHQEEENQLKEDDRDYILDVLNFEMTDIFQAMGINTAGGEFVYVTSTKIDKSEQIVIVEKLKGMGLPISDDYLYETFDVDKPEDYDAQKVRMAEEEQRLREREEFNRRMLENTALAQETEKQNFLNRLGGFFGFAPDKKNGAHLEF